MQPLPEVALYHTLQLVPAALIQAAASDPVPQFRHDVIVLLQCCIKGRRQGEGEGGQRALLLLVTARYPLSAGSMSGTTG